MMPAEKHARMSMSRLPRIIECPGSFRYADCGEQILGEETQSQYAKEGSLLHLAVETYLTNGLKGEVPKDIVSPFLTSEQATTVMECIEYQDNILRICKDPVALVECKVSCKEYSSWLHECEGTCDRVIYDAASKVLYIIDWKFGQGVFVSVANNAQLYGYAAGALQRFPDAEYISIHIGQPRLENWDEITLSKKDLLKWVNETLAPAATEAYTDDAAFNPSTKACKWCPRKATCEARKAFASVVAAKVFQAHQTLKKNVDVDVESLVALLAESDMYIDYIKDVAAFLQRRLLAGGEIPGKKLVHGRSNRSWDDIEEATAFLEQHIAWDDMYNSKFISPSQAEKINRRLKKMPEFHELYTKKPGALTMVDDTDKRPAVSVASPSEIFKDTLEGKNNGE